MRGQIAATLLVLATCVPTDCSAVDSTLLKFERAAKRSLDVAMTAMGPGMAYRWDAEQQGLGTLGSRRPASMRG
jgi:hypothetical protein